MKQMLQEILPAATQEALPAAIDSSDERSVCRGMRIWEEEEEFITSGNWRGKHNSLSRGAGAAGESRGCGVEVDTPAWLK